MSWKLSQQALPQLDALVAPEHLKAMDGVFTLAGHGADRLQLQVSEQERIQLICQPGATFTGRIETRDVQ